jgi:hypothetical protein
LGAVVRDVLQIYNLAKYRKHIIYLTNNVNKRYNLVKLYYNNFI